MTTLLTLRDGSTTEDPRLDAISDLAPANRDYPATPSTLGLPSADVLKPVDAFWHNPFTFDQAQEGACVLFAWGHELVADPNPEEGITEAMLFDLYHQAQHADEWDGCSLGPRCPIAPSAQTYGGTSVRAGAAIIQKLGFIREYRWAFSLVDALVSIMYAGPAIGGLNWHEGMSRPDANGYIHPTGRIRGRHAVQLRGVLTNGATDWATLLAKGDVIIHNSWGKGWGAGATCKMTIPEFDALRTSRGEICIPIVRL